MLPLYMNLKISSGTIGYNNKFLVSDSGFSLGKMTQSMFQCQTIGHLSYVPPCQRLPTPQPSNSHMKKKGLLW